ncbi:hypothetical protein ES677_09735 [Bizionia gelidisalsuginis]|uniref:Uncharacterized protein n=2 Tax=Bizionia TaxID=283785 RepID=A0A8H2LI04_9FLAO|nr:MULTISPECIES: hypothetical protein [Bizionia]TYB76805.1 hypothetical protein ES676_05545 [Bizionia saleffrena]TYC12037.1 hypothetical protein ES677_09735 [Bizionia gelidisalsuginis]
MNAYFLNVIPKIQQFSKKLDDLTLLKNQNWVLIDESNDNKNVFIFRDNNQVIISKNGKVKRENWEYIGQNNLLIDIDGESYLFRHGFLDENIFALKMDSKDNYVFLINESKYGFEINSVADINDFLIDNYLSKNQQSINSRLNNNYEIKKIKSKKAFFGPIWETYKVHFNDRLKDEIYVNKTSNKAYFIDGINYTSEMKRYYINSEYCISALHEFLKTGNISKDGLVESLIS